MELARMGSAAFLAPLTRTSPLSRCPPLMTILSTKRYTALGGGRSLGATVLVAQAEPARRLAAGFLGADLVARLVGLKLAAAPRLVVHHAVGLGAIGALAPLDAALALAARRGGLGSLFFGHRN